MENDAKRGPLEWYPGTARTVQATASVLGAIALIPLFTGVLVEIAFIVWPGICAVAAIVVGVVETRRGARR